MSNAIELVGLTKRYGDLTAVDHLDLTISSGQILALLGPNGAGKSTTTEMILGLIPPSEGQVRVAGMSPVEATRAGLIGAMLQNAPLWENRSVRAMLMLLRGIHRHPIPLDDAVERAGIADVMSASCDKLSGGQAQKVRFAMALLGDPQILLLDEPTAAMDVETRRSFWSRMRQVAREGRTIVFATHYLDEADQEADRVVVMDRGRKVADGTGHDIKNVAGGRSISLTGVAPEALAHLSGVTGVRMDGSRVRIDTDDSDATLRDIFTSDLPVHGVEVAAPRLEDAFVQLTSH
ncbi:ABC transporter ATP-binding protein [Devriesea agamarum]|uniref:ABC transporter ATP-binding protein n=1 Tax=Devriesea agamarum TaxID=472569 RepID=UPI00071D34D1|nr:ABC transporter ATP-binding protein [Devriesea agamarum]